MKKQPPIVPHPRLQGIIVNVRGDEDRIAMIYDCPAYKVGIVLWADPPRPSGSDSSPYRVVTVPPDGYGEDIERLMAIPCEAEAKPS